MLRRTGIVRCLAHDIRAGTTSDYRPRFRPRRLVMPVDTWNLNSDARHERPLSLDAQKRRSLVKSVRKSGALQLSTVPKERTTADAVRIALENAVRSNFTDEHMGVTTKAAVELSDLLQQYHREKDIASSSIFKKDMRSSQEDDLVSIGTSEERCTAVAAVGNRVWDLLERTSMDSPAHGPLALRGKSLIDATILKLLYQCYPRLRSRHAQSFVHQCTGLLAMSRVATRLGLVDVFGVHTEVGLWRELNTLQERFRISRMMATVHKQRMTEGIAAQRRWFWRNAVKSAGRKLKKMPVTEHELRPRMEWISQQVCQFFACVELMEGEAAANVLIRRLFCSQLAAKVHCDTLLASADEIVGPSEESGVREVDAGRKRLAEAAQELRDVLSKSVDRDDGGYHPLNDTQQKKREQFESSFGAHAMEPLKDDIRDEYRVDRLKNLAPPAVVHVVEPQNAFREAQIVLRYDPTVSPRLRTAPIDVDLVIRNQVEVHETNKYHTLVFQQQYRQVEYHVAKLFAGEACIGEGKGETDMLAIQEASIHMLLNYYLRSEPAGRLESNSEAACDANATAFVADSENGVHLSDVPHVRTRVEETQLSF